MSWIRLEPSKGRPLFLPLDHKRHFVGLLVVCLHKRIVVEDLLPLCNVVHVLEGHLQRLLQPVEGAHDGQVGKSGASACEPPIATLGKNRLQRLQPLWDELGEEFLGQLLTLLLALGKLHLGQLGPDVLVVAGDHVRLAKLQVGVAS